MIVLVIYIRLPQACVLLAGWEWSKFITRMLPEPNKNHCVSCVYLNYLYGRACD